MSLSDLPLLSTPPYCAEQELTLNDSQTPLFTFEPIQACSLSSTYTVGCGPSHMFRPWLGHIVLVEISIASIHEVVTRFPCLHDDIESELNEHRVLRGILRKYPKWSAEAEHHPSWYFSLAQKPRFIIRCWLESLALMIIQSRSSLSMGYLKGAMKMPLQSAEAEHHPSWLSSLAKKPRFVTRFGLETLALMMIREPQLTEHRLSERHPVKTFAKIS